MRLRLQKKDLALAREDLEQQKWATEEDFKQREWEFSNANNTQRLAGDGLAGAR